MFYVCLALTKHVILKLSTETGGAKKGGKKKGGSMQTVSSQFRVRFNIANLGIHYISVHTQTHNCCIS